MKQMKKIPLLILATLLVFVASAAWGQTGGDKVITVFQVTDVSTLQYCVSAVVPIGGEITLYWDQFSIFTKDGQPVSAAEFFSRTEAAFVQHFIFVYQSGSQNTIKNATLYGIPQS